MSNLHIEEESKHEDEVQPQSRLHINNGANYKNGRYFSPSSSNERARNTVD